jgi:hypothetical protein
MKPFTALVILYLALDFASPELPGALAFDPDESVEVVQFLRDPAPATPTFASAVTREWFLVPAIRISRQTVRRRADVAPGVTTPWRALPGRTADPAAPDEG